MMLSCAVQSKWMKKAPGKSQGQDVTTGKGARGHRTFGTVVGICAFSSALSIPFKSTALLEILHSNITTFFNPICCTKTLSSATFLFESKCEVLFYGKCRFSTLLAPQLLITFSYSCSHRL